MEFIYIVISQSGSIISKCIQMRTGKNYNHCSISLDPNISIMYSMGRIFPSNPVIGGLVQEIPNVGTYKKFKFTTCQVIKVPVQDHQYELIVSELEHMISRKMNYRYNVLGLLIGQFGIKVQRKDHYMCSEFLQHLLETGNVDLSFLSKVPHPEDYFNIDDGEIIYKGYLNQIGDRNIA